MNYVNLEVSDMPCYRTPVLCPDTEQALAQACAVCSPGNRVNKCNRDFATKIIWRQCELPRFH